MKRYDLIDTIRGLSLISMILFHTCWIANHFGIAISSETLYGNAFYIWERSICTSFIFISGYSFLFGKHHLRSGMKIFFAGLVITLFTCFFLPQIRIVFGVLTLIGTSIFLMIPLDILFRKIDTLYGNSRSRNVVILMIIFILFLLTYNINKGLFGIRPLFSVVLPRSLYRGYPATFLGFCDPHFFSTDYFSLIPWFFLYLCGYLFHLVIAGTGIESVVMTKGIRGIKTIGKHSLIIYLVHPVVIYLVMYLLSLKLL